MEQMSLTVVDCMYTGREKVAAAFVLQEGNRAAIIETNTNPAVPRILDALQAQGLGPEQVEWILVTHVHLDHAGGASLLLEACPNATLVLHPKAAPHMIDPSRLIKSAKGIYGEDVFRELYGEIKPIPEARINIVEDGEKIAFGTSELRCFYTRGHANHHYCVHALGLDAVFAGDSFGIVYPALQDRGPLGFPSTPPTDFDAEAALASIDAILATGATTVYPTHFGAVSEVKVIAKQLREQLRVFQDWVDEIDASGLPDEELDSIFIERLQAFLGGRLDEIGIPADDPRRELLKIDVMLNGQGLAFAVKKRRYKARKRAEG